MRFRSSAPSPHARRVLSLHEARLASPMRAGSMLRWREGGTGEHRVAVEEWLDLTPHRAPGSGPTVQVPHVPAVPCWVSPYSCRLLNQAAIIESQVGIRILGAPLDSVKNNHYRQAMFFFFFLHGTSH